MLKLPPLIIGAHPCANVTFCVRGNAGRPAIQAEHKMLQAELQKQVEQSRALAEAEGRIKENRANEDINRRQLAQRLEAERQKLMEAIDSTFRCVAAVDILAALQTLCGQGLRLQPRLPEPLWTPSSLVRAATCIELALQSLMQMQASFDRGLQSMQTPARSARLSSTLQCGFQGA